MVIKYQKKRYKKVWLQMHSSVQRTFCQRYMEVTYVVFSEFFFLLNFAKAQKGNFEVPVLVAYWYHYVMLG